MVYTSSALYPKIWLHLTRLIVKSVLKEANDALSGWIHTHTLRHTMVCLLWAWRGLALPQRWLIYSLLLSVKQLTDGGTSRASATLSPLSDASQWQECWRLLLNFDRKFNGYHKNGRVVHTLYCYVAVMAIDPVACHLTHQFAGLICTAAQSSSFCNLFEKHWPWNRNKNVKQHSSGHHSGCKSCEI